MQIKLPHYVGAVGFRSLHTQPQNLGNLTRAFPFRQKMYYFSLAGS